MTKSQISVWDFRWHGPKLEDGPEFSEADFMAIKDEWIKYLNLYGKKWAFQLERGEKTDRLHFQGRISLKVKKRVNWWNSKDTPWPWSGTHWAPTSNPCKGNNFYVTKEETRVAGPWQDTSEGPFIQKRVLKMEKSLHPWQTSVLERMKVPEERIINVIIKEGNLGGSTFLAFCDQRKHATLIDCWSEMTAKDLLQMVMEHHRNGDNLSTILFDIPRAMTQGTKQLGLWEAIETIKNGRAFDPRYGNRGSIWFEIPNIWVIINPNSEGKGPDLSFQSIDRWRLWGIDPKDLTLNPWGLQNLKSRKAASKVPNN